MLHDFEHMHVDRSNCHAGPGLVKVAGNFRQYATICLMRSLRNSSKECCLRGPWFMIWSPKSFDQPCLFFMRSSVNHSPVTSFSRWRMRSFTCVTLTMNAALYERWMRVSCAQCECTKSRPYAYRRLLQPASHGCALACCCS